MQQDASTIIDQLLDQNSSLRLELAILSALKIQQSSVEAQAQQLAGISLDAIEYISDSNIR